MNGEILIIVDPQIDFTTKEGSLYVPGAELAMQNLAEFINKYEFDSIIVTCDWHPVNHCSFKENGGEWPAHCIQYTKGAALDPTLCKVLIHKNFKIYEKGVCEQRDEYSFLNDSLNRVTFEFALSSDDRFYIAGVAGDYCVSETIHDLIEAEYTNLVILQNCIASIDGGTALNEIINEYNLDVT